MDQPNQHHDSASKAKICVKIKIPSNTSSSKEVPAEEKQQVAAQHGGVAGGAGGGRGDGGVNNELPAGYRVCAECGKIFSSGKAWGGHIRHHNKEKKLQKSSSKLNKVDQKNIVKEYKSYGGGGGDYKINTINIADVKVRNGKPTCCLCGKRLPSMQSLFGHMRSHSDRDWQGVDHSPQNSPKLEFENVEDEDVYYNQTSPLEEKSSKGSISTDLESSLMGHGWLRKESRGRLPLHISDQAARDLITLSKAQSGLALESAGSKAFQDNYVMEIGKKMSYISNLRDIEAANHGISKVGFEELNRNNRISYPGKNDKRKGNDFDGVTDGESGHQDLNESTVPMEETIFQCGVCGKIFSSGKALGGHKRCHRKPSSNEIGSSTGEDASKVASNSSGETASHLQQAADEDASQSQDDHQQGMLGLGIDLNEPYVMQDGEEGTSFPVDQD